MAGRDPLVPRARALRWEMTDAEVLLWSRLRRRQVEGARFRRQVPIGGFIADFACHDPKLIVEVDGSHHGDRYDQRRDAALGDAGFRVLRFWNSEVLFELGVVMEAIHDAVAEARRR